MIHEHRSALDWVMWTSASLAVGLTLAKLALILSCLAAAISITCGVVKLVDRYRYGPAK